MSTIHEALVKAQQEKMHAQGSYPGLTRPSDSRGGTGKRLPLVVSVAGIILALAGLIWFFANRPEKAAPLRADVSQEQAAQKAPAPAAAPEPEPARPKPGLSAVPVSPKEPLRIPGPAGAAAGPAMAPPPPRRVKEPVRVKITGGQAKELRPSAVPVAPSAADMDTAGPPEIFNPPPPAVPGPGGPEPIDLDMGGPPEIINPPAPALPEPRGPEPAAMDVGGPPEEAGALPEPLVAPELAAQRAQALYERGLAAQVQGNLGEAEESYRRAVEMDPKNAPALNNLGVVYLETGRTREAAREFNRAMEADREFVDPVYNLACLEAGQGRVEQAVNMLRRASFVNAQALLWAADDPDLEAVRQHPRYLEMARQVR